MRLRPHTEPSQRDFDIFWAAHDGATQRALADIHETSQPRVSQIVRNVENWIAKMAPQRAEHTPLQASYLACTIRQHDVEKHQREAFATHRQLRIGATVEGKAPKPDYRWLKLADDFSERKEKVAQRLVEAGEKAKQEAARELGLAEDFAVELTKQDIQWLRETALAGQAEGLFAGTELPAYDDREIELCVRNALRGDPAGRHLRNSERLPPAWQELVKTVYYGPLGGLSKEPILAPDKAESVENNISVTHDTVASCVDVSEEHSQTKAEPLMAYQAEPRDLAEAETTPAAIVAPAARKPSPRTPKPAPQLAPSKRPTHIPQNLPPPGPNTIRLQTPICTPMPGW